MLPPYFSLSEILQGLERQINRREINWGHPKMVFLPTRSGKRQRALQEIRQGQKFNPMDRKEGAVLGQIVLFGS